MNNNWLRKTLKDFAPYAVAPIHEKTVINANESYFNILSLPSVMKDAEEALASLKPQIYPAPMADTLREAIADYLSVDPSWILAGNGGDEVITYIINTFLDPEDILLTHAPTFDMYDTEAAVIGAKTISVPDLPGFKRDWDGIAKAVEKYQPKLTVLCNPNNPTGELAPLSEIERIVSLSKNPVLVDEAYMEFAQAESAISLIKKYPNVMVIRTLSKAFGLAGMRCGYMVADSDMIDAVSKVKSPYNLNIFTQAFGAIALKHRDEIFKVRDGIIAERDRFLAELSSVNGIRVYPSSTNFFLTDAGTYAPALFEALRKADILVKKYKSPEMAPFFRITVTTKDVDERILSVIREVIPNA